MHGLTVSTKQVVTMAVSRKQVKVDQAPVCDTALIYSRVLGLQNVRGINLQDVLNYELAPVPTSMFEDNGDMRITKSKSTLKKKLGIEVSNRIYPQPKSVILDGCAVYNPLCQQLEQLKILLKMYLRTL